MDSNVKGMGKVTPYMDKGEGLMGLSSADSAAITSKLLPAGQTGESWLGSRQAPVRRWRDKNALLRYRPLPAIQRLLRRYVTWIHLGILFRLHQLYGAPGAARPIPEGVPTRTRSQSSPVRNR
jgi:hypothetical protein